MLRVPIYLNHMMHGCSTSRRLKFFVNLIQSSFGAMLMIYFFVHTSLVNSLLFYFCACYFEVLLSKWLLCIFFFCITNQIFCAYIQLYQLPTIVYSTVHIQLYKLITVPRYDARIRPPGKNSSFQLHSGRVAKCWHWFLTNWANCYYYFHYFIIIHSDRVAKNSHFFLTNWNFDTLCNGKKK